MLVVKLWEELPGLAAECLPDDPGDLIGPGIAIDETAHLKKGRSTACVAPQHAGVTGKVENCVTWVFAALVTALGQARPDFDVYMPKSWAEDPRRRRKAGIPEGLAFATEPRTGHRAGKTPGSSRAAGLLGGRRRGVRALRRIPGRVPGAEPGLRHDHPLRLPGHPREEQGHPR